MGCGGSEVVASDHQAQDVHDSVRTENSTARGDHQHHARLSYRLSGRSPEEKNVCVCVYIYIYREREREREREKTE